MRRQILDDNRRIYDMKEGNCFVRFPFKSNGCVKTSGEEMNDD